MSSYRGKVGMEKSEEISIVRETKEVSLLAKIGQMAIVRLRKGVSLLGEKREMAKVMVGKGHITGEMGML